MSISRLVIDKVFDTIWEGWLNKEGEHAAFKAVDVALNSGTNKDDLIKACETYRLMNLTSDPEFTYKLSNFIHQDHWLDVLENSSLAAAKKKYDLAMEVVEEWNKVCRDHWCSVVDKEARIPMVMKALNDKAFRDGWKKALDKASRIWRYPMRENDIRGKVTLSLRWFVTTEYAKHTVLRIVEGEYGNPVKEIHTPKLVQVVPVDEEARKEALEEWQRMFPDLKPKKIRKEKPNEITKETLDKARGIMDSLGIKNEEDGGEFDPFKFL